MYKILTIGGKDYKLEYTVEAALYKDGIDRIVEFLGGALGIQGEEEITKDLSDEDKMKVRRQLLTNFRTEALDIPDTALTMFYAGLLEHHGADGDGSIVSKKDAKSLVKQLFAEQPEDGISDFAALLSVCLDQMGEDGFFKKTGLTKIMGESKTPKPNRAARRAKAKQLETNS